MMNRKPGGAYPSSRDLMLKPGFKPIPTQAVRRPPPVPRYYVEGSKAAIWPKDWEAVSSFMFEPNTLTNSPSLQTHNISLDNEMQLRLIGTCWIKELSLRINVKYKNYPATSKLSVRASCVAMIYFHRFYMYHSFGTFDPIHIATAALFLAAKCEECPKRMKLFVYPLYNVCFPHDTDPLEAEDEALLEELITAMETHILRTLSFELKTPLCHVEVIARGFLSQEIMKAAWQICTDIYQYTTLCLLHKEKVLAAAAVLAASTYVGVDLDAQYGSDWIEKIAPGTSMETIVDIVMVLAESYEKYQELFPKLPNVRDAAKDPVAAPLLAEEYRRERNEAAKEADKKQPSTSTSFQPQPPRAESITPKPSRPSEPSSSSSAQQRHHSTSQSRERHHSTRSEKDAKSSSDRHSHSRHDSIGDRQQKERHREHKSDRHQRESGSGDYRHHSSQHSTPALPVNSANVNYRDNLQHFALNTRQQHREEIEEGEIE